MFFFPQNVATTFRYGDNVLQQIFHTSQEQVSY